MSDKDHRQLLEDLLARRDAARDNVSRVKGKLEAARTELKDVEEECRQRKVKPENLEDAIQKLSERLDSDVVSLTKEVERAEIAIQPFLSEETK